MRLLRCSRAISAHFFCDCPKTTQDHAEALAMTTTTVCRVCLDTHRFPESGHMCTSCPIPCEECRQGGRGAFCESTPCACKCHRNWRASVTTCTAPTPAAFFGPQDGGIKIVIR